MKALSTLGLLGLTFLLAVAGCSGPVAADSSPTGTDAVAPASDTAEPQTPATGVLPALWNTTWWTRGTAYVTSQTPDSTAQPSGGDADAGNGTPASGTSRLPAPRQTVAGGQLDMTLDNPVDTIVQQFVAAATVYGACYALADVQFDLRPEWGASYGTCPHVAFASGTVAAVAYIDFGGGCSSPATAQDVVRGAVDLMFHRDSGIADIDTDPYAPLFWDDRAISGSLDALLTWLDNGIRMSGPCQLNTDGIGSTSGELTVDLDRAGTLTFTSTGSLAVSNGTARYAPTVSAAIVDPIASGNFVPGSGTVTCEVQVDESTSDTITITFTAQTPLDGTVLVSVDGGADVDYQVPGIAP
jgi:hypothetical protein